MRRVLTCNLQLIEAIVQVGALPILIALVRGSALHSSLCQYFLTALSGRVGIGTVTCILPIASLIILLLNLGVELPELNLAALGLIFALGLRQLIL